MSPATFIMFRLSRSARTALLAIFTAIVLFIVLSGDKIKTPVAHIPVAQIPLESAALSSALSAKLSALHLPSDHFTGDKKLRGHFSLQSKKLVEDHYEVKLSNGSKAILTLEPKAQKIAEKVLAKAKAPQSAVVIMKTDGRIVALAGARFVNDKVSYDATLATSVWAPAASIFKLVTASALLKAGIGAKQEVCYHGGVRSVEHSNLVDNPSIDSACNDLGFGIAKSQNALVAKLVHKHLKKSSLQSMSEAFGFGQSPSFSLSAEAPTLNLPNNKLEYARVSAGFWKSKTSILSAALLTNVIASGGLLVTPKLVNSVENSDTKIPVKSEAPTRTLAAKYAKAVAEMMTGTVRYGTAFSGFHDKRRRSYMGKITVAGKTGSLSRNAPSYLAYSWFVGFAPADDPQYVIAILLGNPQKWHLRGHTAARLILEDLL